MLKGTSVCNEGLSCGWEEDCVARGVELHEVAASYLVVLVFNGSATPCFQAQYKLFSVECYMLLCDDYKEAVWGRV